MINKFFMPNAADLPQLVTAGGAIMPFPQLIAIDPQNLMAEYEQHAAWQATIGYACAKAQSFAESLKRRVKRMEASKYFSVQEDLRKAGTRATVDAITNTVLLDPDIIDAQDALGAAEEKAAILEQALRAFIARKDMLVNLGAHERAEMVKLYRHADEPEG